MRKRGLFIIIVLAMAFMLGGTAYTADWVKISGTVLYENKPLCVMVLANGEHMFTNEADGKYELEVPLDENGKITLFSFCDGLSPFKQVLTPSEAKEFDIQMVAAPSDTGKMILTATITTPINSEWVKVNGKATYNEIPLCMMVMANGQYIFTNQTDGLYELDVPLDDNGKITLFGFCDGLAPYKQILVIEDDDNDADNDGDTGDKVDDYAQDNEKSMNEGGIELFMERISENFLNDGQNYNCLYELWKWYFDHYDYMNTIYNINQVSYENKDGKKLAMINRTISYTQYSAEITAMENESTGDITLILEDGKWRFYGNQKEYSPPSVSNMLTCESVDEDSGALIGVKNVFSKSDPSVSVFIKVDNARNGSVFYVRCYKPDNSLFSENAYTINLGIYPDCVRFSTHWSQSYSFSGYENIPDFIDDIFWKENIGIWRVEVSDSEMNLLKQITFEVK